MRKFIIAILILPLLFACTESEPNNESKKKTGSIYGVVSTESDAEPMRATAVELYNYEYSNTSYDLERHIGALLLKTVTYDDGHYEFNNLETGDYIVSVQANGYYRELFHVEVQSGREARADMQMSKIIVNTYMTVSTLVPSAASYSSYILNGSCVYTYYSDRKPDSVGFYYSKAKDKILSDHKIIATIPSGTATAKPFQFSVEAGGFTVGTWYVQAYAENDWGIEYGDIQSFSISDNPAVKTLTVTNMTGTTATLNGLIEHEGNPAYETRGFVYSSFFPNPTINDSATDTKNIVVSGKSKEFSANISNLTTGTKYHVRAYVTNSEDTYYGDVVSFMYETVHTVTSCSLMLHKNDISAGATWDEAYELCKSSTTNGFTDWRLPSYGECSDLYSNRTKYGIKDNKYWTYNQNYSDRYYYYDFYSNTKSYTYGTNSYHVRCVRTMK